MKKTILITGSTDGIGKLTATKLAKDGHEIYVHGRNAAKLAAVISEIKTTSNNDMIKGFAADFSDLTAVQTMATEIQQLLPKLDILINNAGVYKSPVQKNQNGLDIRYVVNYLAPFLLTQELLPLLKRGNSPRIINLSSAAQAPVSIEALKGNIPLNEMEAYAQSKLALTMWSLYLAQTESHVTTIAVNPGSLLNTNMVQQGWGFHRSSADKGRDILYNLAILEEYKNASGQYFDNDMEAFGSMHPSGNNAKAIEGLIKETTQLLNACV